MESAISNTRGRLEIAEALLRGGLSGEEARARRTEVLKRSKRGRLLLRLEGIERAMHKLQVRPQVCLPWELSKRAPDDR
jgi:hypothetical protein